MRAADASDNIHGPRPPSPRPFQTIHHSLRAPPSSPIAGDKGQTTEKVSTQRIQGPPGPQVEPRTTIKAPITAEPQERDVSLLEEEEMAVLFEPSEMTPAEEAEEEEERRLGDVAHQLSSQLQEEERGVAKEQQRAAGVRQIADENTQIAELSKERLKKILIKKQKEIEHEFNDILSKKYPSDGLSGYELIKRVLDVHPTYITKLHKKDLILYKKDLDKMVLKINHLINDAEAIGLDLDTSKLQTLLTKGIVTSLLIRDLVARRLYDFTAVRGTQPDEYTSPQEAFRRRMRGMTKLDKNAIHVLQERKKELKERLEHLTNTLGPMEKRILYNNPSFVTMDNLRDLKKMRAECVAFYQDYKDFKQDTYKIYDQPTDSVRSNVLRAKRKVHKIGVMTILKKILKSLIFFKKQNIEIENKESGLLKKVGYVINTLNDLIDDVPKMSQSPQEQAKATLKNRRNLSSYWISHMRPRIHHGDVAKTADMFMDASHHFLRDMSTAKDKAVRDAIPQALRARRYDMQKLIESEIADAPSDTKKIEQANFFLHVAERCCKKNDTTTAAAMLSALLRMDVKFKGPASITNHKKLQAVQEKCMTLHQKITKEPGGMTLEEYRFKLNVFRYMQNIYTAEDQLYGAPVNTSGIPLDEASVMTLNTAVVNDLSNSTKTMVIGTAQIEPVSARQTANQIEFLAGELRAMLKKEGLENVPSERIAEMISMIGSQALINNLGDMMLSKHRSEGIIEIAPNAPRALAVTIESGGLVFRAEQTIGIYHDDGHGNTSGDQPYKYVTGVTEVTVPLQFLLKGFESLSLAVLTCFYNSQEYPEEPLFLTAIATESIALPEWLTVPEWLTEAGMQEAGVTPVTPVFASSSSPSSQIPSELKKLMTLIQEEFEPEELQGHLQGPLDKLEQLLSKQLRRPLESRERDFLIAMREESSLSMEPLSEDQASEQGAVDLPSDQDMEVSAHKEYMQSYVGPAEELLQELDRTWDEIAPDARMKLIAQCENELKAVNRTLSTKRLPSAGASEDDAQLLNNMAQAVKHRLNKLEFLRKASDIPVLDANLDAKPISLADDTVEWQVKEVRKRLQVCNTTLDSIRRLLGYLPTDIPFTYDISASCTSIQEDLQLACQLFNQLHQSKDYQSKIAELNQYQDSLARAERQLKTLSNELEELQQAYQLFNQLRQSKDYESTIAELSRIQDNLGLLETECLAPLTATTKTLLAAVRQPKTLSLVPSKAV